MTSLPILDHIVILVSYQDLQALPARLKDSLTVIDGGAHADGSTVNKLVIFPDGVYIEFIAFQDGLDAGKRKQHRWGALDEGRVIDWAHTLPREDDFAAVQKRVQDADAGFVYGDPVAGGRIKPEGTELKWAVASAKDAAGAPLHPGSAPFWCLDRTPRNRRVPYEDAPSYTKHPSGAQGVSRVSVSVPETQLLALGRVYDAVHGGGGAGGWNYAVHSGSSEGRRVVTLQAGKDEKSHIALTLLGTKESPRDIEVLPGVVVDFDVHG